jgi:hypothetical protein
VQERADRLGIYFKDESGIHANFRLARMSTVPADNVVVNLDGNVIAGVNKDQAIADQVEKVPYADNGLTEEENAFLRDFPPEKARKAVRKVDHRLVPLLGLFYLLSFIDRANIGELSAHDAPSH